MNQITLKTAEDIKILREAGARHAEVLKELSAFCVPGAGTDDLNSEADRLIRLNGGVPAFLGYRPAGASRPFPASVCVSVNDAVVHGIPNESRYVLRDGDIVSVDIGFSFKDRITDAAVTVCVGSCPQELFDLSEMTKKALQKGIGAIRPFGSVGDIGAAVSSFVRTTPFRLIRHLAGHGVGFSVHEDPLVPNTGRRGTGELLEPGLVIAIEPMLTTGSGNIVLDRDGYTYRTKERAPSAHWEHTVVITERGFEIVTEL